MVTALDQPEVRVRGLEAGADDFLTKPVNDLALFCRLKSLVRLKMLTDELRARSIGGDTLTLLANGRPDIEMRQGRILVVDNRQTSAERIKTALEGRHDVTITGDPQAAIATAGENVYELIIVSLDMENVDGLRICSQFKSLERTRQTPILIVVDPDDHQRLMRGLDMGVNDYLIRPVDRQELLARVNTQVRRWRYAEKLRNNVQASIEMAITDPLTGLYNRRYMEGQMAMLVDNAANRQRCVSVIALDADHFKSVNDTYGHDVGDRVLQEIANRIKRNVRNVDMACRTGGEEFIVVLPDTEPRLAEKIAERVLRAVSAKPFSTGGRSAALPVTVSIGVAGYEGLGDRASDILKRADQALYRAKHEGRNRIVSAAA
jgi:two-component system, cell cycle response regulator